MANGSTVARASEAHRRPSGRLVEVFVEDRVVSDTAGARTQVFIVRIWYEAQGEGRREVRIQARHVLTGETRYFLAWPALTAYLAGKLDAGSSISDK
jgi:hypothetical protein